MPLNRSSPHASIGTPTAFASEARSLLWASFWNSSRRPVRMPMFDKATWPVKQFTPDSGVRIVPGGSSIRDGCYIGKGVTCMPPMYINTGTWVGEGTMVDSHALIGSCAQIGNRSGHD